NLRAFQCGRPARESVDHFLCQRFEKVILTPRRLLRIARPTGRFDVVLRVSTATRKRDTVVNRKRTRCAAVSTESLVLLENVLPSVGRQRAGQSKKLPMRLA